MTSGKRVLAAGKFDILHLGHIAYLEQARELAGKEGHLIVVVALDKTIKRERGAQPVFPEEQRRRIVQSLGVVDEAVLGYDTEDHTMIVKSLRPDVLALGYDQRTDIDALQQLFKRENLDIVIVRLEKREANGLCSSTRIRKRILRYYSENGRARTDT
jgi:FAD synthetase